MFKTVFVVSVALLVKRTSSFATALVASVPDVLRAPKSPYSHL